MPATNGPRRCGPHCPSLVMPSQLGLDVLFSTYRLAREALHDYAVDAENTKVQG